MAENERKWDMMLKFCLTMVKFDDRLWPVVSTNDINRYIEKWSI